MQIRWLRTFRAVVDEGSFEMAGRAMNCTQSTVSFQVKRLEEELGVELFDRVGRRMQLNDAGRRCLAEVDAVLGACDRLLAVGAGEGDLSGTLRVVIPESLLTLSMQPVFARFRKLAPAVRLFAGSLNCYAIGERLAAGDFDLSVCYDVGEFPEVIETTTLEKCEMGLAASSELDERDVDFVHPGSANRVTLITNDTKSFFTVSLMRALRKNRIRVGGVMEIDSVEAVRRCVVSNMGVAFMPRRVFAGEIASGTVKILATVPALPSATCVLARSRNKTFSASASLFRKLTLEHFSA